MLLNDKFDVWQVPLDGGKATNLTQGVGRAQQIQFRLVRFGARRWRRTRWRRWRRRCGAAADSDGVDLSKPVTLSAYGEWTKKSGYCR